MTTNTKWTHRWNSWLAPTTVPNVWQCRDGGHLVRARVVDPTTGRMKEVRKVLPEADLGTAFKWLQDETARVKSGVVVQPKSKTRFASYVVSLLERKIATKDIKSAKGRAQWVSILQHLVDGTSVETREGTMTVTGFGELYVDQIRFAHVEAWRVSIARLIAAGAYSPNTTNGWLRVLKVITKAAKRDLGLPQDACEGVRSFDTSEHPTYTDEEPNSLTAEEVRAFLSTMRERFPQHFAMTYLGFCTGSRPSSMRPLRRLGSTPDVLWEQGALLIRRSQTVGDEVMNTTKTGFRQRLSLPAEVIGVLRWHVETQLVTHEQKESELLFPSLKGRFRATTVLNDSFAAVSAEIGLTKHFTPRGLRRTFQDLARAASVESLVQKSISGHATDAMKDHYSTVAPHEQRASIGRVIDLMDFRRSSTGAAAGGGTQGGMQTPAGGTQTTQAG